MTTPETGRSTPARAAPASGQMTRTLTLLFAVAGGAAVGNLYYAQPLLDVIARSLGVGISTAGLLITSTQVGYAVGIVLIVPLGDVHSRRRMVPVMMMASAASLALCAAAPDFAVLALAMAAVGVTTVSGQILVPFAGDLADDKSRGRILGIVVSGLLTGILGARILGGLIGGAAGWRSVFAFAAGIMVVLAGLIWRLTPEVPPKMAAPYGSLLRSVAQLVGRTSLGWLLAGIAAAGGGLSLLALILWAVTPRTLRRLDRI